MYSVWNHPPTISLKTIKMIHWTYPHSAQTEKDSEEVSSEIPAETQSQHSPLRMNSIYLRNSTTHNLLTHILKNSSCQNRCKKLTKMFNCINLRILIPRFKISSQNQIALITYYLLRGLNWCGKVLANTK